MFTLSTAIDALKRLRNVPQYPQWRNLLTVNLVLRLWRGAGEVRLRRKVGGRLTQACGMNLFEQLLRKSSVVLQSVVLTGGALLVSLTSSCSRAEADYFQRPIVHDKPPFHQQVRDRLKDRIHECAALFQPAAKDCVNVWVLAGSIYDSSLTLEQARAMAQGGPVFVLAPGDGSLDSICATPVCLCVKALLVDAYKDEAFLKVSDRASSFHLGSVSLLKCSAVPHREVK
jgi:hypothetical protein